MKTSTKKLIISIVGLVVPLVLSTSWFIVRSAYTSSHEIYVKRSELGSGYYSKLDIDLKLHGKLEGTSYERGISRIKSDAAAMRSDIDNISARFDAFEANQTHIINLLNATNDKLFELLEQRPGVLGCLEPVVPQFKDQGIGGQKVIVYPPYLANPLQFQEFE